MEEVIEDVMDEDVMKTSNMIDTWYYFAVPSYILL